MPGAMEVNAGWWRCPGPWRGSSAGHRGSGTGWLGFRMRKNRRETETEEGVAYKNTDNEKALHFKLLDCLRAVT